MTNGGLDEALARLHRTGPEFAGWLSNHGPMVAEAMTRRGLAARVPGWLDRYLTRLDHLPRGLAPIQADEWRQALGDPRRVGDWREFLLREVAERPWREVLTIWWPRLLPGIAASATHGVIRVGHAVEALLDEESTTRTVELAHALAYWAARWQPVVPRPEFFEAQPSGQLTAAIALRDLPRVPDQSGGIQNRLGQLPDLPQWTEAVAALRPTTAPAHVPDRLGEIVAAAIASYLTYERHGDIMLIHAATAPHAVRRTLPALPDDLWLPSLWAAWTASAAIVSAYADARQPAPIARQHSAPDHSPDEIFDRAVANGDEHVIKFADTAIDVYAEGGDPMALAAVVHAIEHVRP